MPPNLFELVNRSDLHESRMEADYINKIKMVNAVGVRHKTMTLQHQVKSNLSVNNFPSLPPLPPLPGIVMCVTKKTNMSFDEAISTMKNCY